MLTTVMTSGKNEGIGGTEEFDTKNKPKTIIIQ
jgi:hypothetical protein